VDRDSERCVEQGIVDLLAVCINPTRLQRKRHAPIPPLSVAA
jgi:hypothetical protein